MFCCAEGIGAIIIAVMKFSPHAWINCGRKKEDALAIMKE